MNENSFLRAYVISSETCAEVRRIVTEQGMNMFTNALCGDNLVKYYDDLKNEAEKSIYQSLKRSPYRSYVNRLPAAEDRTIYIMIVDKADKIAALHLRLKYKLGGQLNMITYPSDDYKGYSYIKIYNKNASKRHMIEYICSEYGIGSAVSLHSSADGSINSIAHDLKKSYEPLIIGGQKNKAK